MNKTTIFLFSVLSLIVVVLGFTFYDFNSKGNQNITFRKKGVIISSAPSASHSGAEKIFTSNPMSARKIKIRNYYHAAELTSTTHSSQASGYIRSDLSLMANNGAPRVVVGGSSNASYRRYIADYSASYSITGVASPQALHINTNRAVASAVSSGVVATGPMMGAVMDHDHIFDPLNPDKCGQDGCDAIPTFPNGWGDGILEGDTEIEWVPLGDFAYPILLLAAIYMIFIVIRKRTI